MFQPQVCLDSAMRKKTVSEWWRSVHVVQYLRAVCQNSSPPPRHSPRSEYLCNRKDSTDAENRERKDGAGGVGVGLKGWEGQWGGRRGGWWDDEGEMMEVMRTERAKWVGGKRIEDQGGENVMGKQNKVKWINYWSLENGLKKQQQTSLLITYKAERHMPVKANTEET